MNQNEAPPAESKNWLQRLLDRAKRDVVIAQVGAGARNVVIGTRNVQINIGNRNLTVPVLLIPLLLSSIIGILVWPSLRPIWYPSQMTGRFDIAVAEFGVIDDVGNIRATEFGSSLSYTVFDQLQKEYAQYPQVVQDVGGSVLIWHDTLGPAVKNVTFGVIKGRTATERAGAAEKLAGRIGADLVIYGNLRTDEDPNSLELEYYYKSPNLADQFDASSGSQRFGLGIPSNISFQVDETLAKAELSAPLAQRTTALFWLTVALTYDAIGNYVKAGDILNQARALIESSGRLEQRNEVIYYFQGRAASRLEQYDAAIAALEEAIAINPLYTNAYISLGGVYFDRAQKFYSQGQKPLPGQEACVDTEHSELAVTSPAEAMRDIERSIELMQKAQSVAQNDPWPPIQNVARLALGLAYQLKGQALIFGGDLSAADALFAQAEEMLQQNLAPTAQQEQYDYLGWSHMGLGASYHMQSQMRLMEQAAELNANQPAQAAAKKEAAMALLDQTIDQYQQCIDQREPAQTNRYFQFYVLQCGCEPLQRLAQETKQKLEQIEQ